LTYDAAQKCQARSKVFIDDSVECTDECRMQKSTCCQCGDGEIVYSRTGSCKKCNDGAGLTYDAPDKCQVRSSKFIDDSAECTATCRNDRSKCCQCGDDETVYSRTGSCANCKGGTDSTYDAPQKCQARSPGFIDDSAECTASCRNERSACCLCGDGHVIYSRTGSCKKCEGGKDHSVDAPQKCQMRSSKFIDDSQECTDTCKSLVDEERSMCCKCNNGDVVYSRGGSCKNCNGKPKGSYDAPEQCQKRSAKFIDDSSKCTASCKSLVSEKR